MDHFRNYHSLAFQRRGKILSIVMNRPEKRNAVDDELHEELGRVFYDAQTDRESDVIVLTGTDRWFCAGGDMSWFQECIDRPEKWRDNVTVAKRIINGLLELEKPIICRLNGAAAGLGASVALMCDIVVAVDSALICDPHVKMGLVAADGGAIIWPQLIGFARAKEMLLTGRMMTASEGVAMCLIYHAVPAAELDAKVDALADQLAGGATWAIRWTKTIMNIELRRIATLLSDVGFAYETVTNHMEDHQEAVNAFREKRRPNFTGN